MTGMLLEVLVAPRRAFHEFSPCEPKGKPCSFSCCVWGSQQQEVTREPDLVAHRLTSNAGSPLGSLLGSLLAQPAVSPAVSQLATT